MSILNKTLPFASAEARKAHNAKIMKEAVWTGEEIEKNALDYKRLTGGNLKESAQAFNDGIDFREAFAGVCEKRGMMESANVLRDYKNNSSFSRASMMMETQASTDFSAFLRAGAQSIMSTNFETIPDRLAYSKIAQVIPSSKDTELIPSIHGITMPKKIPQGGKYPEGYTDLAGDFQIRAEKYGEMLNFTKESLDDDVTGMLRSRISLLSDYFHYCLEILVLVKMTATAGTTATYQGDQYSASLTKPATEANWPWSTALRGGGRNRPNSYAKLSVSTLNDAWRFMATQKDVIGGPMGMNPDSLLIHTTELMNASIIQNSSYNAAVPSATPGATGGAFSINAIPMICGKFNIIDTPFMPDNSLNIYGNSSTRTLYIDSKKANALIMMRQAPAVVTETAGSGAHFERDVERTKISMRASADVFEVRAMFQINDGSVA